MESDPRWPGVLDAIEADAHALIAGRFATDLGASTAHELYVPPPDLGALPIELRTRAEDVVTALAAAGTAVEIQLAAIRGELRRVNRPSTIGSNAPAHEFVGGFDARV